jgi:hypothetical protein
MQPVCQQRAMQPFPRFVNSLAPKAAALLKQDTRGNEPQWSAGGPGRTDFVQGAQKSHGVRSKKR